VVIVAVLWVGIASAAMGQAPVSVVTDSPNTVWMQAQQQMEWLERARAETMQLANQAEQLIRLGRQIDLAIEAIRTQEAAMKALDEGDWDGFKRAMRLQTRVMRDVADMNEGFAGIAELREASESARGFRELAQVSDLFANQMAATSDYVSLTGDFVQNTPGRLDTLEAILNRMEGEQSHTAQLEGASQVNGLMTQELMELKAILAAQNRVLGAQIEMQKAQQDALDEIDEQITGDGDDWVRESEVSAAEFERNALGKKYSEAEWETSDW